MIQARRGTLKGVSTKDKCSVAASDSDKLIVFFSEGSTLVREVPWPEKHGVLDDSQ